jgi:hypothetical protein
MTNSDVIRYDLIVQEAMLGVVKKVLIDAQKNGLKNDHHFYLTYSTCFEGVEIPSHLLEKYPDEITIVLQHEFEDLIVQEDYFMVTLWFNNVAAHLRVPFKAIKAFFDPSVKFGLQFNIIAEEKADITDDTNNVADITANLKTSKETASKNDTKSDKKPETGNSNIVSLDSFRKK